ncbi:Uncharacterised protein [uncultured archaeon]|nr:Uncharacterised protein [uncultured archaeon]
MGNMENFKVKAPETGPKSLETATKKEIDIPKLEADLKGTSQALAKFILKKFVDRQNSASNRENQYVPPVYLSEKPFSPEKDRDAVDALAGFFVDVWKGGKGNFLEVKSELDHIGISNFWVGKDEHLSENIANYVLKNGLTFSLPEGELPNGVYNQVAVTLTTKGIEQFVNTFATDGKGTRYSAYSENGGKLGTENIVLGDENYRTTHSNLETKSIYGIPEGTESVYIGPVKNSSENGKPIIISLRAAQNEFYTEGEEGTGGDNVGRTKKGSRKKKTDENENPTTKKWKYISFSEDEKFYPFFRSIVTLMDNLENRFGFLRQYFEKPDEPTTEEVEKVLNSQKAMSDVANAIRGMFGKAYIVASNSPKSEDALGEKKAQEILDALMLMKTFASSYHGYKLDGEISMYGTSREDGRRGWRNVFASALGSEGDAEYQKSRDELLGMNPNEWKVYSWKVTAIKTKKKEEFHGSKSDIDKSINANIAKSCGLTAKHLNSLNELMYEGKPYSIPFWKGPYISYEGSYAGEYHRDKFGLQASKWVLTVPEPDKKIMYDGKWITVADAYKESMWGALCKFAKDAGVDISGLSPDKYIVVVSKNDDATVKKIYDLNGGKVSEKEIKAYLKKWVGKESVQRYYLEGNKVPWAVE